MSKRLFTDGLVLPSNKQTSAQFDGTAGNGRFPIHAAALLTGIVTKNDNPVDWNIELELPDPDVPATPIPYPWVSISAQPGVVSTDQFFLPRGSAVIIKNGAGSANCVAQIIYRLVTETL